MNVDDRFGMETGPEMAVSDSLSTEIPSQAGTSISDEWSGAKQLLCDDDGQLIFPSECINENLFETDLHGNSNNASPEIS